MGHQTLLSQNLLLQEQSPPLPLQKTQLLRLPLEVLPQLCGLKALQPYLQSYHRLA